jgi:hypothetical protein
VRPTIAHPLIDAIRDGSFVFAYYPDPTWMTRSRFLGDCAGTLVAATAGANADSAQNGVSAAARPRGARRK